MATDNELLTQIAESLETLIDIARGEYDSTESVVNEAVDDVLTVRAAASPNCVKRVAINTGNPAEDVLMDVYEDGKLVAKDVPPGESWVSDLDGGGAIAVQCGAGLNTTVTITSYLRSS